MTQMTRTVLALAALGLSLVSAPVSAQDTWTTPFPGIRHLHRTAAPRVNINAAVVDLCAPGVSVRHTAFEEREQRTSAFATSVGAQWAINGDFSCRPSDVLPGGTFAPCEGFPRYMTYGIAAHAGVQWGPTPFLDAVLAFAPGRVEIYNHGEHQVFEPWMQEVLSGHFDMVVEGAVYPFCGEDERPPRTVIGLSRDRTQLIMAVSDGRGSWSGRSCAELAALLIELGAWNGFNLDGGGSSTMWSAASGVLNHPSDGGERVVGPHLAIFASGSGPSPFCDRPGVDPMAPLPMLVPSGPRGRLNSAAAARVFDTRLAATRAGIEGLSLDASGRVAAGTSFSFAGLSSFGVPAGSAAAVVRLTATDETSGGFATVFPAGIPTPDTSTLNHTAGTNTTNLALGGLGTTGRFSVYTFASAHYVADLDGYFGPTGSGFFPENPRRPVTTRGAGPLVPGVERNLGIAAPAGTTALALNVATLGALSAGSVSFYPCGEAGSSGSVVPVTTSVVSMGILARSGPAGLCAISDVEVHLLVDITGTFAPGGGLDYQPLVPVRLIDSRTPGGIWFGRTEADTTAEILLARAPGYPVDAQAVALNVTSVSASDPGFVSFYPCAAGRLEASSLNYAAGAVVANSVIVGTGDGRLCAYVSARTHLLVDIVGVFVPPSPPPTPDAGVPPDPDAGVSADPDAGASADPDAAVAAGTDASVSAGTDASVSAGTDASVSAARDVGLGRADADTSVPSGAGCGCVVTSVRDTGDAANRTVPWALAGFALLMLARRRRARCVDAGRSAQRLRSYFATSLPR